MKRFIAAMSASLCVALAARAEEGCSKDADCKADRVCVQRQCTDTATPATGGYRGLPPPVPGGIASRAADRPAVVPFRAAEAPALAPAAAADGNDSPKGDTRHHHLGGFLQPDLGFGYLVTRASQNGVDATIGGPAGVIGLAFGGALWENTILAFRMWDAVANDPAYEIGGSSGTASGTLALMGFGPDITMYTQDNFYVSFAPSLTRMTTTNGSSSAATEWGVGLRAALGKEWWVSDHWGLGLVAHVSMSLNQDTGTNPPMWTSMALGLAFSATYN